MNGTVVWMAGPYGQDMGSVETEETREGSGQWRGYCSELRLRKSDLEN